MGRELLELYTIRVVVSIGPQASQARFGTEPQRILAKATMITRENWRERMENDMQLRDLRPRTVEGYLLAIRLFVERVTGCVEPRGSPETSCFNSSSCATSDVDHRLQCRYWRNCDGIGKRNAQQEVGLQRRATVHTLRHSYATHLVEHGIRLRAEALECLQQKDKSDGLAGVRISSAIPAARAAARISSSSKLWVVAFESTRHASSFTVDAWAPTYR